MGALYVIRNTLYAFHVPFKTFEPAPNIQLLHRRQISVYALFFALNFFTTSQKGDVFTAVLRIQYDLIHLFAEGLKSLRVWRMYLVSRHPS